MIIQELDILYADEPGVNGDEFFFGKRFRRLAPGLRDRLLVHRHYPRVGTEEMARFIRFAQEAPCCAVTACTPEQHPYLLFAKDETGHDRPLCDIPREARGERRNFPQVLVVRPAMVWLPKCLTLCTDHSLRLFSLPYATLLDQSNELERVALCVRSDL